MRVDSLLNIFLRNLFLSHSYKKNIQCKGLISKIYRHLAHKIYFLSMPYSQLFHNLFIYLEKKRNALLG